ncbi:ankyrin repeat domain-containing protein [Siccirubricoccus sp. G192]|uniref:ankyrin repeat domain-containing protein n=1 Tax=Siccirubricoccus sp. G192 TaxID=2849651 RepID=UPI001C2BA9A0|nr:ankyrin repeat domain-containing protein [Siccirubricoccus sp. G192]MBV1797903.1 ankyrin repeat domain-containing protein [Siccirubricoccus sp. G192]
MSTQDETDLIAAVCAGDIAGLRARLSPAGDAKDDCSAGLPNGLTPLMVAAACGHQDVVELLLQCGADPTRRDRHGRSAAAHARVSGHPHLAERLDIVVDQEKTMR